MAKFEITIDLIVEDRNLDAVPDYGNRQVSSYYCVSENTLEWDVTLTNTVEAETAEDAADTITEELRGAFSVVDPNWNAIIFEDDNEVLELEGILE
jgi:hypothetical protein